MTKMKVNDFIKRALEVEKIPTLYGWGKYMNDKQGKHLLCDCSGLIKGILWGYPEKGKYINNGVPDINADTMISKCSKVSSNFSKLAVGALVWIKGHIGIHVGNGVCVESSPAWENGIQCTFIKGSGYSNTRKLKERQWSKQGLFDTCIDYTEDKPVVPKPTPSGTAKVKELQKALNDDLKTKLDVDGIIGPKTKEEMKKVAIKAPLLGSNKKYPNITKFVQKYVNVTVDGKYGKNTKNAVKVFQKKVGITQDGEVGINTLTKLSS